MALLTANSDSLNLYLRLIDITIKAADKLCDISSQAGCSYLNDLYFVSKSLLSFRDKVLKDLDYEKLSPSA